MNHTSLKNRGLKFYGNLFLEIFKISTASMLVYRANLIFFFVFETLFLVSSLVGLSLGVDFAGGSIMGWSKGEILFVAMLFQLSHQVFVTFFLSGPIHVGWYVWSGKMDFVLLKPLNPLVSMHAATEFVISNLPNLLINTGLFAAAWINLARQGHEFSAAGIMMLPVFVVASLAVRYGIALLLVSPTFFSEKASDGEESFWSIQGLGRYPSQVFPKMMELSMTFLLPIATMASIPSELLFKGLPLTYALWSLLSAFGFAAVMVWFFLWSSRRYQSINTGA